MIATSGGHAGEGARGQVLDAPEIVPPRVREVLVPGHDPGVLRPGHHPAPAELQQGHAHLAHELVVHVVADTQRQVDLLGLEAGDLAHEEVDRRPVVRPRHREELVVAVVAAEDGVGQVQEDDRRLGEVGEALVLEAASGHQVAGSLRLDERVREHGPLLRHVVHERLAGERPVVDVGPAIPRRALPEALGGRVRVGLGRLQAVRGGEVRRVDRGVQRPVRADVGAVERLGRRPDRLAAEAQGLALVRRQRARRAVAREDRDDRDVLPKLAGWRSARRRRARRRRDGARRRRGSWPGSIPTVPRSRPVPSVGPGPLARSPAPARRAGRPPGPAADAALGPPPEPLRPAARAEERHEDARAVVRRHQVGAAPLDEDQVLLPSTADRDHQPSAVGELRW